MELQWQLWGMLSTIAAGLAIDVYSPISGNADGIAEMAEMSHKICQRTDSRASLGGYISSQSMKKIIEINSYMLGTMAGRAAEDHIKLLHQPTYRNQRFKLWLSYFEIYGGKLFDLLSDRKKLCMREDGRQQVCIVGPQEFEVFGCTGCERDP